MITQEYLKSILYYNPETGIFIRTVNRSRNAKIGDVAGYKHHSGYKDIIIKGKTYRQHRLAWLYVYGEFPKHEIDHVNGIKDDNRLVNLRECTRSENQQNRKSKNNSSSKYVGVNWSKNKRQWRSRITINGVQKHIGYFDSEIDAFKAYCKEKLKIHTFNPKPR